MRSACFAVLLLLAPLAGTAQDGSIWTEEQFLATVAGDPGDPGDHPAVAALAGEREVAAAEVLRASLLPNPAVEASVEEPDGDARETTVQVTWTPPLGGRRALRRTAAELGLAAAEAQLGAARLRLRRTLRTAYADWAFAEERRELHAAHLTQVSVLAERARARAQAGEIPGLAARRLTLEESQARTDLGRAEAVLAAARAGVAAWAPGLPAEARPAPLPLPPASPGLPSPLARPDLAAREREVERAEAVRRLSARVLEEPAFGLGWKRIEEREADLSGPVVSVGWTLPLFNRRQADQMEAEARLGTARAELELARTRATAELAGAAAAYQRLRSEAERASGAVPDELLAGAEAAYRLGESGLTDFLDSLRSVLAARLSALEVREAAAAALRDLEAAAGRPLGLPADSGDLP